jgi:hypothetical protein
LRDKYVLKELFDNLVRYALRHRSITLS